MGEAMSDAPTTNPPDGTRWVRIGPNPSTRGAYFAMRNGVLMIEFTDGQKPRPSLYPVEIFRCYPGVYTEIPPDGPPAHSAG